MEDKTQVCVLFFLLSGQKNSLDYYLASQPLTETPVSLCFGFLFVCLFTSFYLKIPEEKPLFGLASLEGCDWKGAANQW